MKRKIFAFLTAFAMLAALSGCNDDGKDSSGSNNNSASSSEGGSSDNSTAQNGDAQTDGSPDDTWSVFVYLCGSDLESNYNAASNDIQEMISSSTQENVKFIVETGGSSAWANSSVSPDKAQRFEICGGKMTLADETDPSSMGDANRLKDFLTWGYDNYPATKTALILWDHGGGSVAGVCFDDLTENSDSLTLPEIDTALSAVTDKQKFEFVGYDACLMATYENAAMLSKHANYMIGSQEIEPGCGWDFETMGQSLTTAPEANGSDIGQVICDSFMEVCTEIGAGDQATLSVTDLSQITPIAESFDAYFKQVYEQTNDIENLVGFARNAEYADKFGGNNKNEGYTNMVDLASLVECSTDFAEGGEELKDLISGAVTYSVCGTDHEAACGLSLYYPIAVNGSEELGIFNNICTSPYYMAFVNRIAYASATGGDLSGFDDTPFISGGGDNANVSYADNAENRQSKYIKFEEAPALDDAGTYSCILSDQSVNYIVDAQGVLEMLSDDRTTLLMLGFSHDCIDAQIENGIITDNFDGTWFALGDGQLLSVYPVERTVDFAIYSAPVKVNGRETNLRIKYDLTSASAEITGIWDGIDENGSAARNVEQLKEGDKIVPMYYVAAVESDDEAMIDGDEFVYDGDTTIYYQELPDGSYLYGFNIDDLYGDSLITDLVEYTVNGDTIGYNALLDKEEAEQE